MIPLYLTNDAAKGFYWAILIIWVGSELVIGVRHVPRDTDAFWQDRLSGPALIAGVFLAIYFGGHLAEWYPAAAITTARPAVFALGVILGLAGVAFRQYAVATLGRFFTTRVMTQPGQTVVQTGPYRYVRHPSYSGMLVTVFGVLLCSTNWLTLACFLLAVPGMLYRIQVEEGALGEPYRSYMARTKRLVPFVV